MDTDRTPSIEDIWALVQRQQATIEAQREEHAAQKEQIARLEAQLRLLHSENTATTEGAHPGDGEKTPRKRRVSRAGLIKAALAGAIGVVGADAVRPGAALADSNDGDIQIGYQNFAGESSAAPNRSTVLYADIGFSNELGASVFTADATSFGNPSSDLDGLRGYGAGHFSGVAGWGGGSGGVGVIGFSGTSTSSGVIGKQGGPTIYPSAGVVGASDQSGGTGVAGIAGPSGTGVYGEASGSNAYAVYAEATGGAFGVYSYAPGGVGLYAQSTTGFGVHAIGFPGFLAEGATLNGVNSRGGRFISQQAQIRLNPANAASPPNNGQQAAGDFFVSSYGHLYYYNGSAWVNLA